MDLDSIYLKILETIEALSTISGVDSRRCIHPEEAIEILKLSNRDYANYIEDLSRRGLLQVSTGIMRHSHTGRATSFTGW